MMIEIALQEFNYRLRRASTWIYFAAILIVSFLVMVAASGGFPGKMIGGSSREWANSPYMLHQIFVNINFIAVMLISAIMGQTIFRDFDKKTWQLFFTKPVSKRDYVFGRFFGSFTIVILIMASMGIGAYVATLMPFVQPDLVGPNRFFSYVQPYLISIVPTNFVIALVFCGLVLYTRKMTSVYIGSVVLFITYAVAQEMLPDMNNKLLASLVDPFGFTAFEIITKYWTVADKNSLLMPVGGVVLANRFLWLTIGTSLFLFFYNSFSLVYDEKITKRKKNGFKEETVKTHPTSQEINWGNCKGKFSRAGYLKSLISEVKLEFELSFKNRYLLIIVSIGLLFLFAMSTVVGNRFGTPTLPVTFEMLEFVLRLYSLVLLIAIIFLSGEMVWRSRAVNMDQVNDCNPLPSVYYYLSRVIALHVVVIVLLLIVIPSAMLIQAFHGFFNFKLPLYLFDLFVLNMTRFSFFIFLAFFVHILVNNKSLGHLMMVLYYIWGIMAPVLGLEHLLFVPMKLPKIIYSDMNGYGFSLEHWLWHAISGYGGVLVLIALSSWLWVRGMDDRFRERVWQRKGNFRRWQRLMLSTGVLVLFVSGSVIIYNTVFLNEYITKNTARESAANYEILYRQYENLPQPSITDVFSEVDIFPHRYRAEVKGKYELKNSYDEPIEQIIVSLPTRLLIFGNLARGLEIDRLDFSIASSQIIADKKQGFYVYQLDQPLLPGESCSCEFEVQIQRRGFSNSRTSMQIVDNGTFINSYLLFPTFGYNRDKELIDPGVRKKFNLPPRQRVASIKSDYEVPLIGDYVNFEAVVSTCKDQVAIAPGKLIEEWSEGDRNFYRYKSENRIWAFFTFQSAKYELRSRMWRDHPLSVYFHPEHDYNVDAMLEGIENSLDYFTQSFSPFEEGDVKIVEFPRYSSFALSMPNTIPFSEEIGFIANVDRESKDFIDYPFFITSHEVAHHWWGNQVVASNVQGGLLIDESLAEYSAMMVLKKRYGVDHVRRLNKYKLDRYFEGRSNEVEREMPLYLMENQGYLHYEKGGLSLYAMQELIGEEAMNRALKSFLDKYRYSNGVLPKSTDLIEEIRSETPEKYHQTLFDYFYKITLFDFNLMDAEAVEKSDEFFELSLILETQKFHVDEKGSENPVEVKDWIDIEVRDFDNFIIDKRKVYATSERTQIKMRLQHKPASVIVDPDYHYINKRLDNNKVRVNVKEEENGNIAIRPV